jgi:hypothetical protein
MALAGVESWAAMRELLGQRSTEMNGGVDVALAWAMDSPCQRLWRSMEPVASDRPGTNFKTLARLRV